MITAINIYLITDGQGQEAVDFYKEVFQADVTNYLLWKDGVPDCPANRAHLLMNAQLVFNGIRLQISDENPDFAYKAGSNMSAAIIVDSPQAAQDLYQKLATDAQAIHLELQETFWSPAYANLTDKFGMMWQINTEIPTKE